MNDKQHLTSTAYSEFNLPDSIQQGLQDAGFEYCTPIQAETLPYTLKGQDIAGEAQTGTGKTAAFLVALFNHLIQHPAADSRRANQPRALVLAPTRELALQIHKDAEVLGKHTGFKIGLVYGGTGYNEQRQQLTEGVDVLIGTPGRIIDYFKQKVFDLRAAQVVVLDEADRMFDLGFIKDIRFLIRRCPDPDQRLSMLFSATLSHRVNELAYEHMNNPHNVCIESETRTADNVKQTVYYPANEEKIPLLLGLLQKHQPTRAIVFINTKHTADKIYAYLKGNDIPVAILSGDVPQTKRTSLLQGFQDGKFTVLVATDVAARGLHIPEVSHVINFDLPQSAEDYVHRVGRTARAGAHGQAISFACEHYAHHLPEIEEYLGHRIDNEAVDLELLVTPKPPVKLERRKPDDRKRGPKRDDKRGGQRSPKSGPRKRPRSGKPPEEHKAAQQKPSSGDSTIPKKRQRRKPSPKQTTPRAPQPQQQRAQAKKPGVIKRLIDSIFG